MDKHKQRFYNLEIEQVLGAFKTSKTGLPEHEVQLRQQKYGPNVLRGKKTSIFKRIIEPFSSAFVLVLLLAMALSLAEQQITDAAVIGIIVMVNAIIFYIQQYSVSKVLKTLRSQDVSLVDVIRGGETVRIPSEQLTLGDVIHISEGVKVPADGRLIESNQVHSDEAVLTGESLPVHKTAGAVSGEHPPYGQLNMLFKGSYVRSGTGLMLVTAIGDMTELGGINALASSVQISRSPIERKIDSLTRKLMAVIILAGIFAIWLSVARGTSLDEALRFSISLVVSAVPEGLPVALTIVLLLNARRMAKVKALVKKTSSIETMGAVTMIATDKTGTITENKLSIAEWFTTHRSESSFREALRASLNDNNGYGADPLDRILYDAAKDVAIPGAWHRKKDFAFSQQLLASGVLWQHGHGYTLYIKGAPEHILGYCSHINENTNSVLETFTGRGYRTIGIAHKDFVEAPTHFSREVLAGMEFDGFVGLADGLRPHIADAVQQAQAAGIKVVMLTGDHVATAGHIAQKVGIAKDASQVADSSVLEHGTHDDIRTALQSTRVFGRVLPEHKFALLQATRGREITAMTGDGVNDIPALVQADTGLAMGSGTDAAKDASDIVLMDDNFGTIVAAIRAGRTALTNIRKMLVYLLGTSSGEVLTVLSALLLGLPVPVTAIQILWVNLATDSITVIPLGLSPEEPHSMKQPPKDPRAPLLDRLLASRVLAMAVAICVTVLAVFYINLDKGIEVAQTLAFLSLIVIQWANALAANFEYKLWFHNLLHPNKKLLLAISGSIIMQLFVFMTPFGQYLDVVPVEFKDALLAIALPVIVAFGVTDLHKLITRRFASVHTK